MFKNTFIFSSLFFLCLGFTVSGQDLGNSPYSRLGLGETRGNIGGIRNIAMGGGGVASANAFHVNELNPALLHYNRLVTFEIATSGQLKKIATNRASQVDGDFNFGYLALAVPVSKKWSSAVGLKPYSTVSYQTATVSSVQGEPNTSVRTEFAGDGVLSEAYFAHSLKLAEGLTIGATGSFLFGTLENQASATLLNSSDPNLSGQKSVFRDRTNYSDVFFKSGASYRNKFNEKLSYSLGAVYGFETKLKGKRQFTNQRRTLDDFVIDEVVFKDSLRGTVDLPGYFQVGLALDNATKWGAVLDFSYNNWADFRSFDGLKQFENSYKISVGGEYTPDATSVGDYLKRVTYRGGMAYAKTPIEIRGNQMDDYSVSFGATFPIGKALVTERSFLNIAMVLGKQGTKEDGLIKENYARINVGLSLNNRWFLKRKID